MFITATTNILRKKSKSRKSRHMIMLNLGKNCAEPVHFTSGMATNTISHKTLDQPNKQQTKRNKNICRTFNIHQWKIPIVQKVKYISPFLNVVWLSIKLGNKLNITYPAINVNKISGFVQIYSTVGERVPICRRRTLLNTCATSFLPSKSIRFKF